MQFYGTTVEKPVPAYQFYKGDVYQLVDQTTSFVMSRIDTWIGSHNQSDNAGAPSKTEISRLLYGVKSIVLTKKST